MKSFAERAGENLKTLRKETDLTQGHLAEQIGVATSTIATWEQGTRLLPIMIFDKLSKAFNMTPVQFFERIFPK